MKCNVSLQFCSCENCHALEKVAHSENTLTKNDKLST